MKMRNRETIYIVVIFALAVITIVGVCAFDNYRNYGIAARYEDAGDFKDAEELYESLGGYKDSEEKLSLCRSAYGEKLTETGEFGKARKEYRKAGDKEGLKACDYSEGEYCLLSGEFEKALDIFTEMGDYEDSPVLREESLEGLYKLAQSELAELNYDEAERLFIKCGDYKHCDKFLSYMDFRSQQVPSDKDIMNVSTHMVKLKKGDIYYARDFYYYIPEKIDENTKCSMYFAGGNGGLILQYETVKSYFKNYEPNAIMVFYMGSGINNLEYKINESFEILNYFTVKNNITIHDLIITGSSLGCATALKAAVRYYDKYNICPVAVGSLDNACDWDIPFNLNDEELELLAQSGTIVCLYEQSTELFCKPMRDIRDSGSRLVMIDCLHEGHDAISRYGFRLGCFESLWTGKFDEKEYKTESYNLTGNEWQ